MGMLYSSTKFHHLMSVTYFLTKYKKEEKMKLLMQIFCTFCPLKYDKGIILKLVGTKMHIVQGKC